MMEMVLVPKIELKRAAAYLSEANRRDLSDPLYEAISTHLDTPTPPNDDEALRMSQDFPAYWRRLPDHWVAVDTYRVDDLFPLPSSRLFHARKKLLVPGIRTGGKSLYDDIKEAHRTLGSWLADQPEHSQ